MHCGNRPCCWRVRILFPIVAGAAIANGLAPTKSVNPCLWRMKLVLAPQWLELTLDIGWSLLRSEHFCLIHPGNNVTTIIIAFFPLSIQFINIWIEIKCTTWRGPTISFFFCRNLSLHRNTTADLKTKHMACNSSPFLILPRKSEIFSHSTPP